VLDKTGELGPLLAEITATTPQQTAEWFDGYLNSFYRSLKAWRRGDELAGRIEAAESAMNLMRTLFSLEGRWAPYPNRLRAHLDTLDGRGWAPGELERALLELVASGDPGFQQELEASVEELLRARGFGHVVDDWDGEIERVREFSF
jgi:hypothetical protein